MNRSELLALPLGTRVVVRYRLHGDTHKATDALGELTALGSDSCTVTTRRGPIVIALTDIVAAKTVPPPPEPRIRRPPA
jgi:hypothetical protein